jgi:YggT family protein
MIVATVREDIAGYVEALFLVYSLLIIAYIILSLFFAFGARPAYSPMFDRIFGFLRDVAEPLLAPFRKIIPTLGPLDLSPIVALIALRIVGAIVVGLIEG